MNTIEFGGDVLPARSGPYEREYGAGAWFFCYYSAKGGWGMASATPEHAFERRNQKSPYQSLPWRGLAEEKAE